MAKIVRWGCSWKHAYCFDHGFKFFLKNARHFLFKKSWGTIKHTDGL